MPQAHPMAEDDYLAREAGLQVICFCCRAWAGGIDPGVAAVECPSCGCHGVHAVNQALLLAFILIRR